PQALRAFATCFRASTARSKSLRMLSAPLPCARCASVTRPSCLCRASAARPPYLHRTSAAPTRLRALHAFDVHALLALSALSCAICAPRVLTCPLFITLSCGSYADQFDEQISSRFCVLIGKLLLYDPA